MKTVRIIAISLCVLAIPALAGAQDLGSTSGMFSPKSSKKRTVKKTTSKKKTPARKKSTPKRRPAKRTSKKQQNPSARKSISAKERVPKIASARTKRSSANPEDVVITVGEKTKRNTVEMFDDSIATGNAARNQRRYLEAEHAYSKAQSIDPEDSRAIYGLGNIYSDQQRWEEAEAAYRKAIAIEPDNPLANIALSFVLTQPVVGSNLGERFVEAERFARKAISLDAENAIGYDQLGVAMELRGIISTEAEDAYRKAIALDPTFALAYAHLGRLLRKRGQRGLTNESSAAYRRAIKLAVDVPTMILVADVMQSQQRYLDSEQLLREALRRDPRNPTGLYLLGRALTTRKNFVEAEEVLKKSVGASPNSFVSYALLGSLYSQSGDLPRAEQALVQALGVITGNEKRRLAQEFEEVGDALVKKHKYRDAARLFRRAISLDPGKTALSSKLASAESKK
jgi:tetratricopeptide (TPR) repeat protein